MATQDTIDAVRRAAQLLRGITELADQLQGVNSIENDEAEARVRRDAVGKEIEKARIELAEVKKEVQGAMARAEQTVAQAHQEAERIARDAQATAEAALVKANQEANAMLDAAKTQVGVLAHEKAELAGDFEAMKARCAAIEKGAQDKLNSAKADLADLEARISEAKEQVRKILGQ